MYNFQISLFNSTSSIPEWTYDPGDKVDSVAISSNGFYIATGIRDMSPNNRILIFNKTSSIPMLNLTPKGQIDTIDISDNGRYIVAKDYYYFMMYDRLNPEIRVGGAINFFILPGIIASIEVILIISIRMRRES